MNPYKKAIDHLNENHMSYYQHMVFALFYGCICLIAGVSLLIHSIFPCFFQTAGSDLVKFMAIVFKKHNTIDDT
jgi:hypothetical protein